MSDKDLLYRIEGSIAYVTINREKQRNSISSETVTLFREYLDQAEKDETVRVLCITGAGEKAFCSGADLGNVMSKESAGGDDPLRNYADLLKRIASFPKPTVARVNGYCLAGGTGFMLACDIVIARDDTQFGTPEVNVGLFPMMIGALIFKNVPRKKAMEMVLLGDKLSSAEALDMGLITRSVPFGKLDEEVGIVLKSLAAKSPVGMKIGKEAFYAMDTMPFEEALDYLCGKLAEVASTEDAVEGITAFIEKRPPVFKGK
ncbi:MAG: enoyl-CoA hydratase-related protein [Desulfobacterales bacterium]